MKSRSATLHLAQWGQLTTLCLPVYLAQEAGFLKKAGIKLRYTMAGNADAIAAMVADGACDLAVSGPTMCALKDMAQHEMKVIGAIVHRAAVHGLSASPIIQEIDNVKDFAGLRIGTAPRPSTAYSLMASLKKENKRVLKNMRLIEAPIGQQIESVTRGNADLYIDQEPYVSLAESKGYRIVFSATEMFGPLSFTALYGRTDRIAENEDAITALCAAVTKACDLIYSDPEKVDALTVNIFKPLKPEIVRTSVERLRVAQIWPKRLNTTKEAWNNAVQIRRNIGMRFVRNTWDVVDNRYVNG